MKMMKIWIIAVVVCSVSVAFSEVSLRFSNINGTGARNIGPITLEFTVDFQGVVALDASTPNTAVQEAVNAWDADDVGTISYTGLWGTNFSITLSAPADINLAPGTEDFGGGALGLAGVSLWYISTSEHNSDQLLSAAAAIDGVIDFKSVSWRNVYQDPTLQLSDSNSSATNDLNMQANGTWDLTSLGFLLEDGQSLEMSALGDGSSAFSLGGFSFDVGEPLTYTQWAADYPSLVGGEDDDDDADNLTNIEEFAIRTSPVDPDTDDDGLLDGVETDTGTWVSASDTGTSPHNDDMDDDGLLDGVESNTGIFVSSSDTGSNPFSMDTDGDGIPDGEEVAGRTDPNVVNKIRLDDHFDDGDLAVNTSGSGGGYKEMGNGQGGIGPVVEINSLAMIEDLQGLAPTNNNATGIINLNGVDCSAGFTAIWDIARLNFGTSNVREIDLSVQDAEAWAFPASGATSMNSMMFRIVRSLSRVDAYIYDDGESEAIIGAANSAPLSSVETNFSITLTADINGWSLVSDGLSGSEISISGAFPTPVGNSFNDIFGSGKVKPTIWVKDKDGIALLDVDRIQLVPVDADPLPNEYEKWALSYDLVGDGDDDQDNDNLSNLAEYGLGGNPINALDQGYVPVFELIDNGGSNVIQYVYNRRDPIPSGMSYCLEWKPDLNVGDWTNSGCILVGTGAVDGDADFKSITNQVPMEIDQKFIRLTIEQN